MKFILTILSILFISFNMIAQQWQIEGTELKALKKNGDITLSFTDDGKSLTFASDTIYVFESTDSEYEHHVLVIVKSGDKLGIIDPEDIQWIHKPKFTSVGLLDPGSIIVGENGKYGILSLNEIFEEFPDFFYDTLFSLTPPGEPVYNNMHFYITRNKKKYGLLLVWWNVFEYIPCKYDEIQLLKSHNGGIVYKFRKGKKWGAGDCEGLEVSPMYDDIKYITGSCANNYFIVEKNRKLSIHGYSIHALYPFIFDAIQYIPGNTSDGYLILKSEGKMDVIDFYNFEAPPFQGRYDRVWIEKRDGNTVINMEREGEKTFITVL